MLALRGQHVRATRAVQRRARVLPHPARRRPGAAARARAPRPGRGTPRPGRPPARRSRARPRPRGGPPRPRTPPAVSRDRQRGRPAARAQWLTRLTGPLARFRRRAPAPARDLGASRAAPPWQQMRSFPLQLHRDAPLLTLQTHSPDLTDVRWALGALDHTSCVRRRWASCVCDAASSRSAQLSRRSSAACRCTSAPRHSAARARGVRACPVRTRGPWAASVRQPAWQRTLCQLRCQLRPAALLGRGGGRQPPLQVLCALGQQCYSSRC